MLEQKVVEYANVYVDECDPWKPSEIKLDMLKNKDDFLASLSYNNFNEFVQMVIDEVDARVNHHENITEYERFQF